MGKEIFVKILWDEEKNKKKTFYGKVWGKLSKKEANATAVLTGDGLVVVDIDTKDLKTIDKKLVKFLGEPTVETKRGYHYYYNVPDSSKFTTRSKVVPNVDLRGDGGLIFNDYWGKDDRISYQKVGQITDMPKKLHDYILAKLEEARGSSDKKKKKSKFIYDNTDKKRVKELLSFIKCYDDYDDWYQVGMALKAWDPEKGLKLWDEWSKQSESYDGGTFYKWKSFATDGDLGVGTLYHLAEQGGYVIPHAPVFKKREGRVSVASKDYVAPEMAMVRDEFHYETWMSEPPIDKKAVKAYLKNTGYDPKNNKFRWVSSSGKIRDFTRKHMKSFFKYIKAEETEETLQFIDEWLDQHGTLKDPNPKEYWKHVYDNMETWIMFHHQYNTIRLKVDPFKTNGVAFDEDNMVIVTDKVIPKRPNKVIDEEVMADYKSHFPQLDEVLSVMLSARFGADRKKAYTWMMAESDWGKSFFFDGVLGALGIITIMTEKELKLALSGAPSGLSASNFARSWVTVFDEFSGAVKELKNITHQMIIAPKGQARVEVDLYSKIFLSAENVNSLRGDGGVEKQFANRFMMMELKNKLTSRELYNKNQAYYFDVVKWYVYDFFMNGIEHYLSLGENKASVEANKVLNKFRGMHLMEAEDLMESTAEVRVTYYQTIRQKLKKFGDNDPEVHDLYAVKDKVLYIKKLGLAREHFLRTMFAKNDMAKLNHKSSLELLGVDTSDRTYINLDSVRQNAYKISDEIEKRKDEE